MKRLVLFIGGTLLFGAVALGVGYWVGGEESLTQAAVAFGLTFVPAAISLAWVVSTYRAAPQMQLLASLGGSGLRMVIALGGGVLLANAQPQVFDGPFWGWLVLFYLVFLGFEITLLVRQQPKLNGAPQP